MEIKDLLNDAEIIIQNCDYVLNNSTLTENYSVIDVIKREFTDIANSIEKSGTIPVLNKQRKIYSTFIITDSANLSINRDLFDLVFIFAEKIKKINQSSIHIKWN